MITLPNTAPRHEIQHPSAGSTTRTADLPPGVGRERAKPPHTVRATTLEARWKSGQAAPRPRIFGPPRTSDSATCTAGGRLRAAALQIRWEMTVGPMDGSPLPATAWDELVALAQPRIRAACRTAGASEADIDDCIQESWLELLKGIHRLDPDSTEQGIACWLQTIARRTTVRVRRRQAQSVLHHALTGDSQTDAWQDPESVDPVNASIDREAITRLRESVHSLRAGLGAPVHLIISRYLAGETNLTAMARQLGISRGRLFHRWRAALHFLRRSLV